MGTEFGSRNLIFLISQQRAGSTLLQRILAGHPEVHTTAEPWLMLHPVYALREEGHQAEYNATLAHEALSDFLETLGSGQTPYLEALQRMALYLYGTACEQAGRSYFLDKTPRYFLIIPELARIFPEAKFIILLRNPLAVLSSILDTWVKGHWILLARYRQDLLDAPHRLLEGMELLGERGIAIHYESLVSDPSAQVEQLCHQLGLSFHPAMLEYGAESKSQGAMGDPTGVAKHTRPTTGSRDKWLDLGRESQTRHLAESYLQALGPDVLGRLGYDYAELETWLQAVPSPRGNIEVSWSQLFAPDDAFARRTYLAELALLEHRRFVHWARSKMGKRGRKRGR